MSDTEDSKDSAARNLVQKWNRIFLASADVYYASQLVALSSEASTLNLKYPLLCLAIITYCKAFTTSRIEAKEVKLLQPDWCPPDLADAVHEEMRQLRNKLLAHTEYDLKEPSAHLWYNKKGETEPLGVIVKGSYAKDLVDKTNIFAERINKTLKILEDLQKTTKEDPLWQSIRE